MHNLYAVAFAEIMNQVQVNKFHSELIRYSTIRGISLVINVGTSAKRARYQRVCYKWSCAHNARWKFKSSFKVLSIDGSRCEVRKDSEQSCSMALEMAGEEHEVELGRGIMRALRIESNFIVRQTRRRKMMRFLTFILNKDEISNLIHFFTYSVVNRHQKQEFKE